MIRILLLIESQCTDFSKSPENCRLTIRNTVPFPEFLVAPST